VGAIMPTPTILTPIIWLIFYLKTIPTLILTLTILKCKQTAMLGTGIILWTICQKCVNCKEQIYINCKAKPVNCEAKVLKNKKFPTWKSSKACKLRGKPKQLL